LRGNKGCKKIPEIWAKSIQRCVEKYSGDIMIDQEKGVFILSIWLNHPSFINEI
jgi:hypothetical protein